MIRLIGLLALLTLSYMSGYTQGYNNGGKAALKFDPNCKKENK